MAREAAETLSHRSVLGILSYVAGLTITVAVTPGEGRHRLLVTLCGLLLGLVGGVRLAAVWAFDRFYTRGAVRWQRCFRAGVYTSALVWVVFALERMSSSGPAWPTWMVLLMSIGIAAGAITSLCPDPLLLYTFLLLLLGPLAVWGLLQRAGYGNAIALVVAIYLIFIQTQARHSSRAFRQSALDKQALRETGRHRDALVNSIDCIVWEADPRTRQFTFISGRAETLLGYPVERWMAESSFWADHLHPDDRERAISSAGGGAAGGYTVEYRMLAADGRAIWFRDIVTVAREDGHEVALRGVMVDISAQKQAGAERNMLADALRTVKEAVAISDLEDRIIFVNDSFVDMYGYTSDEIVNGDIRLIRSTKNPPELHDTMAESTEHGGWQGEVWSRRKDGSEFLISLSKSLVRDQSGRTVARVGVSTDITERKNAEHEWKRAKEAAEAASRAKGEFLANVSHELRTPMNGIIGMNQLLLDSPLDSYQRRYGEVVRDSAGFLLSVLNDILDFSRIEAGKLELETIDFDLHAITGGVCDLLAAKAHEKGLELLCLADSDVPTLLRGDPTRLRQVLTNLVSNAVKFTETGEVTVRVRLDPAGPPGALRFEVDDTGIGVPPGKQDLLFQPFYQVDSSPARHRGGTGLGLTIVRRLVERMGGQVGFTSETGRGSRFWFTVPFALQEKGQHPPRAFPGKRALVVDRNAASRRMLARLLADWGCRAELAADGEAALTCLHAGVERFDALVVDSRMLREGRPLWVSLSEDPALAGTPVVLISPLTERVPVNPTAARCMVAVTRPVKQADLGDCLASLWGVLPALARARTPAVPGLPGLRVRPGVRLLVVEDNATNREIAIGILHNLGYGAVDVAADGKQALQALAKNDFDLVLMDCQMPEMDGYETTRQIRRSSTAVRNGRVPIVAMTAYALPGAREQCLDAGMNDYVTKPIQAGTLEEVLHRWVPDTPAAALRDPQTGCAGQFRPFSGEMYRMLFERNLAGMFHATLSGRILECNQAAAAILRCGSPAEVAGKSLVEFHDSAGAHEQMVQALVGHKVVKDRELKLRGLSGEPVWVLANIVLVDEGEGGLLQGTLIDITERKRTEERLHAAKDAAEQADLARSSFLAHISHEIRTPMNGILGMASLLLEGSLDPRQRKRAETVRDSAGALLSVLNDILDFSKMGAGKMTLDHAEFDLRSVVEGVADMMAVKAQEKRVELLCMIEQDVPTRLRGDAGRLRQVLVNLCGNAVKFTAAGEVSIRVKLAGLGKEKGIRFDVTDTGTGIPEGKQHLLFQPFSQLDPSTAGRYGGTGLGLSIVRMLVEIMKGEVGFRSEDGRGSCFWFTIPMDLQSGPERPRALSLAGARILVVDDNVASRGLILELLAFWQAAAEQAPNAHEALNILRGETGRPFDAVLMDVQTLGSLGPQFLTLKSKHQPAGSTAVVLMGPLSQAAEGERWSRLGYAGFVGKPVKQGELGACLASALGHGPAPVRPQGPAEAETGRKERSKLRLLVVEDNEVNQEVAMGILENLGHRADVVADGPGALAALGREDYDLVLMDCQMPGMDGYETTRLIRRSDTPVRNHDVPIIATTANAMAGDREKCLAAGMDGYVPKPLRRDALEQAMQQCTGGRPAVAAPANVPRPDTGAAAGVFDREGLVERLIGNEELAQRVIRRFVADMPGQLAQLGRAVSESDSPQVRLLAHSIKGAAGNVGGLEMREVAWKLEQKGTAGDLTGADAVLPELSASFDRVKPIMEGFCEESAGGCG
jgi:PAS domain S-box-containing protein